jgi:uncharacterized RDD family membrane protein YckC
LGAWTIDAIVIYAILTLLAVLIGLALVSTSSSSGGEGESGVGLALFFLLFPLTPLYSALLHRYWRGQTLGKRAVRIAVVRRDGSAINLGQSRPVLREDGVSLLLPDLDT